MSKLSIMKYVVLVEGNSHNRPPLVIAIVMQVFQQFTSINAIMFYAPILFQTVGFKNDASLLSSIITGLVNVLCIMVFVLYVDKGAIGTLLWINLKSANSLNHAVAIAVVVIVCTFVSCFAWSWSLLGWLILSETFPLETRAAGYSFAVSSNMPWSWNLLGWLIPSETFPLETRAAGYSFAVSSNMFFTFIIAQAFLSMLCCMRASIFYFFSGWIIIMGLRAIFLAKDKGHTYQRD